MKMYLEQQYTGQEQQNMDSLVDGKSTKEPPYSEIPLKNREGTHSYILMQLKLQVMREEWEHFRI